MNSTGIRFGSLLLMCAGLALASAPASALDAYGPPVVTCVSSTQTSITLQICGDAVTGAPAGVSIQWKTAAEYAVSGWDDNGLCKLSLSGLPGRDHGGADSRWDLGPGECQSITVGGNLFDETGASGNCLDDLLCDTEYVFRAFAHADRNAKRSDFTDNWSCTTAACDDGGCTHTQGYWKTHGPVGCQTGNNSNEWAVTSLNLGGTNYSDGDLCSILNTTPANCGPGQGANAVTILQHQLIAALLSQASGADASCVSSAISTAQTLLTGAPACVGSNSALGQQMTAVASTLDDYNNGELQCAGHCGDGDASTFQRGASPLNSKVKRSTWGELKAIYR